MKREKKKMLMADLSLLLVAIFWGGGFVAVKEAITSIKPFYMIAIRFTVSAAILLIFNFKRFKEAIKALGPLDIRRAIVIGIFLFLGFASQTAGAQYTTAGKQAFLTGTNVVLVPFLVWLLYGERLDIYAFSASFLCLIGIGFLTLNKSLSMNFGDSLTLLCALFFAIHISLLDKYAKRMDAIVLTIIQMTTTAVLGLIFALIFEPFPKSLPLKAYGSMAYIIIFSTMLGFLLQTWAQSYTTASHTSIILSLESLFGAVLAIIFLKDNFTPIMIVGAILILLGVLVTETKLSFLRPREKSP